MAGFPETIQRSGRLCGCGWGDGYHACHSSGVRPLADLPPRSYAARTGTPAERIAGCPTCRPRPLPGVDPITSPRGPETFYHRFDQYAAQVSHREAHANRGPVTPITDPEFGAGMNNYEDPSDRSYVPRNRYLPRAGSGDSVMPTTPSGTNSSVNATADGSPAAPAMSVQELEEFRQYQAEQRERKKIEKYLIGPEDIEPSQTFGGPPVGSQERRKLDEAKIERLRAQIEANRRQQQMQQQPYVNTPGSAEDVGNTTDLESDLDLESRLDADLTSPSDQTQSTPMDDLLPPFPREEELRQDEQRRRGNSTPLERAPSESTPDIEDIPPGLGEQLDRFDSIRPESLRQTQLNLNAPAQRSESTSRHRAFQPISQPQARVAEVPDWRFVKQPR
ncbi:hypothetical protein RSSM_04861 [Rhodopirellula sallentina SM41]|uniref:Uncharacterized protein n=2 Tax=Rhodopirellula TaxID=265488 RepID=M5TX27_9BACT|nr:hypothetical protein RSSM_04861 [Rhodopirellula sallentina SM41]